MAARIGQSARLLSRPDVLFGAGRISFFARVFSLRIVFCQCLCGWSFSDVRLQSCELSIYMFLLITIT